jgi:hypothetical protein
MNDVKCPIRMAECMGRKCAFYDVLNRRCPHGPEAARENQNELKSIAKNLESILTLLRYRI